MAVRPKAWVCRRSLAGIVGSNPAGGINVYILLSVVRCQVEVSSSGLSPLQRRPVWCCESESNRETSDIFRPLVHYCCAMGEKTSWRAALAEKLTGTQLIRILWNPNVHYTTNHITRKLQTFINKCLRRIMNIKWTDKITNEELWRITKQKPIEIQIKKEDGTG